MSQSSSVPHLPDLRVLPLVSLLPHEHTDPQRVSPLIAHLQRDGVLRNPPIVAPLDEGRQGYVVLDGANRVAAFLALGIPHIVAQVVDYRTVRLEVWHHALHTSELAALLDAISEIEGVDQWHTDATSARAWLARREALACLMLDDSCRVLTGGHNARAQIALLNQIVKRYLEIAAAQRTLAADLAEARAELGTASALVLFPRFEMAEIADLARQGILLPAGITRHILPLRALRVNYPLEMLHSHHALETKQTQLDQWVRDCMTARRLRIYTEPTVLFDE